MRRFRPDRRDEGAAAVEFALLFPIFMLLVMGTITVATAFSRQINVTQAAREAARYGATYDITTAGGTTNWLQAVDTAVTTAAGPVNNPIGGYNYRCVAIVKVTDPAVGSPAVDTTKSQFRAVDGSTVTTGTGACPSTASALIRGATYVQVVLSRDVTLNLVVTSPQLHVDGVSVTPYEGRPL